MPAAFLAPLQQPPRSCGRPVPRPPVWSALGGGRHFRGPRHPLPPPPTPPSPRARPRTPAGYASPAAPELARLAAQRALTPVAASERALARVPPSFLGLSVDLNDIEGVAHPDYIGLIKHLTGFDTVRSFGSRLVACARARVCV